jgi:1-phosphatidylinositol-3-phosphate 5-kinase
MGVVDFPVLQRVRSFIVGPTPTDDTADGRSQSGNLSHTHAESPLPPPPSPTAARSGGGRSIALRRQISSPQLLRYPAIRYYCYASIPIVL